MKDLSAAQGAAQTATVQTAIVGMGRIGHVLARCAPEAVRIARMIQEAGQERPATAADLPAAGAVWLSMPNSGLAGWLHADGLASRAICTQNGFFDLPAGATRVLIYFAATDRSGSCVPGGPSLAHGPRAAAAAALLQAGGIAAEIVPEAAAFRREVAIKTGWCHALGLIGERLGLAVGPAAARPELEQIAAEIGPVLSGDGPIPPGELVDRWRAYSASIPGYPARLRDRAWRTQPILDRAAALGHRMPLHAAWLAP